MPNVPPKTWIQKNKNTGTIPKGNKRNSTKYQTLRNSSEKNDVSTSIHTPIEEIKKSALDKERVIIKKIVSPYEIYVAKYNEIANFKKMTAAMDSFYRGNFKSSSPVLNRKQIYCVYSYKDKHYVRAEFVEMLNVQKTLAKMWLIDYADEINIDVKLIQPLARKFSGIPRYQHHVKLAGIIPYDDSNVWNSAACNKLEEIIHEPGEVKFYTAEATREADGSYNLYLLMRNNVVFGPLGSSKKETLSVAHCLVAAKSAKSIQGFLNAEKLVNDLNRRLNP